MLAAQHLNTTMYTKFIIVSIVLVGLCHGAMSHNLQGQQHYNDGSPNSYNEYNSGHYPRHLDSNGHVQGSYSYNDPKNNIRTAQYTGHNNGFNQAHYDDNRFGHTQRFTNQNTDVVERANQAHYTLYNKIAADHAAIGAERASGLYQSERYKQRPAYQTYY